MQTDQQANEFIKTLIMVNSDRQSAFMLASSEVQDHKLKEWLDKMIKQSLSYKEDLLKWLQHDHHTLEFSQDHFPISAKVHKLFLDLKFKFAKNQRLAALNSCEWSEKNALKIYDEILSQAQVFSPNTIDTLKRHQLKIKEDLNLLSKLRKLEESEV